MTALLARTFRKRFVRLRYFFLNRRVDRAGELAASIAARIEDDRQHHQGVVNRLNRMRAQRDSLRVYI